MYVCGITVYDYCHLGHARSQIVFDMVSRYLREIGYEVTYVRNITDIDDKIIARAGENNESVDSLTERYIKAMNEDFDALNMLRPESEPRATQYIPQIISMIEALIANGFAYVGDNGDVYYDVSEFDNYGKLSGKQLDDLQVGARIEVDETKKDPLDFVLWKAAKPGEPTWGSPWGPGRPGWHIECSAMSVSCLGEHFDIHGGGMDLKFPHHENEIAQACGATSKRFVNYWLHNGFLQVDEEKMSKSLGNFFTIRDVTARYHPEVVRFFVLNSHYRSPLNYSDQQLDSAKAALERLYLVLRDVGVTNVNNNDFEELETFHQAMADDFNTPQAIAVLFDIAKEINREKDAERRAVLATRLRRLGAILGILQLDPEKYLRAQPVQKQVSDSEIDKLVEQRDAARAQKDWAEADRIRGMLQDLGIVLEDDGNSTRWRRK